MPLSRVAYDGITLNTDNQMKRAVTLEYVDDNYFTVDGYVLYVERNNKVDFNLVQQWVRTGKIKTPDYISHIACDASLFHISCARKQYGREEIDTVFMLRELISEELVIAGMGELYQRFPKDNEGNLIHLVTKDEQKMYLIQCKMYKEEPVNSCDVCLKLIH